MPRSASSAAMTLERIDGANVQTCAAAANDLASTSRHDKLCVGVVCVTQDQCIGAKAAQEGAVGAPAIANEAPGGSSAPVGTSGATSTPLSDSASPLEI